MSRLSFFFSSNFQLAQFFLVDTLTYVFFFNFVTHQLKNCQWNSWCCLIFHCIFSRFCFVFTHSLQSFKFVSWSHSLAMAALNAKIISILRVGTFWWRITQSINFCPLDFIVFFVMFFFWFNLLPQNCQYWVRLM